MEACDRIRRWMTAAGFRGARQHSPDQEFWSQFSTKAPADTIINDPDFYCAEGSMVGVAFVP